MSIVARVAEAPERVRARVNRGIRQAAGLSMDPPPICEDPAEAYQRVDAVARLVHGDLPAMMVGGIASLFFEMLHPHTMAGVAQHSRYRDDPLGRVLQTATFIGTTTYGPRTRAVQAFERVRAVHEGVRGVADDGVAYVASDSHLLEWIHCAGTEMFLRAYQSFGRHALSAADADEYVADVAGTALDLGALEVPRSVAELEDRVARFRPELRLSADGAEAGGGGAGGGGGGAPPRGAPPGLRRARRGRRPAPPGRLPGPRRGGLHPARPVGSRPARGARAPACRPGSGHSGDPGPRLGHPPRGPPGGAGQVAIVRPPSTATTWPVT
jgi:hypothetical protein